LDLHCYAKHTSANGVEDALSKISATTGGNTAVKLVYTVLNPLAGYTPTIVSNIDEDVLTAIPLAQALATAKYNAHQPIDIILEGRNFGTNAAAAYDLTQFNAQNVSVVILQDLATAALNTLNHGYAAIGVYAGLVASKYFSEANPDVSIADSPAAVGLNLEGNIQAIGTRGFVTYGYGNQALNNWNIVYTKTGISGDQGAIYDKHYVALRIFPTVSGVYVSQSWTCGNALNNLNTLELARVFNKAARKIYSVYVPYINKKVRLQSGGTLAPEKVKAQEQVGNQVFIDMASEGDISAGKTVIDPTQNIATTSTETVTWGILPMGKLAWIMGTLKYTVTI
jgi:uncharacterized protein DUF2586